MEELGRYKAHSCFSFSFSTFAVWGEGGSFERAFPCRAICCATYCACAGQSTPPRAAATSRLTGYYLRGGFVLLPTSLTVYCGWVNQTACRYAPDNMSFPSHCGGCSSLYFIWHGNFSQGLKRAVWIVRQSVISFCRSGLSPFHPGTTLTFWYCNF